MQHDIFLSYSRRDSEIMERIRNDFTVAGFSVWTDKEIELGTPSWQDIIQEKIEQSGCVVVLMSPNSKDSEWVKREIFYSKSQNKLIIPILVAGDERTAIPFALMGSQHANACDDYSGAITKLINKIREKTGSGDKRAHLATSSSIETFSLEKGYVKNILPGRFVWCGVPEGEVILNDASERGGTKGGKFTIKSFYMSKFPITNLQYSFFISAQDGYSNSIWWSYSKEAKNWRVNNTMAWKSGFPGDDLPCTQVNWYDAMAFCNWLSSKTSYSVTLPTEQQWQRAAQGDDNRMFPWGDKFEDGRCNHVGNGLDRIQPVSMYPKGASPYSVKDLVGNSWQWCLTSWSSGSTDVQGTEPRVVRGGSYYADLDHITTIWRDAQSPSYIHRGFGFRVACSRVNI